VSATPDGDSNFVTMVKTFNVGGDSLNDVGAWHLVDPTTKQTYTLAVDIDTRHRYLASRTWTLESGKSYPWFFYTAALPATMTSAVVDLGSLGAKTVPVTVG
jgi:hypothetical protein